MDIAVISWLEPLTRFLLGRSPLEAGLTGMCVGWLICPIYMYLLALGAEARWPRYEEQFKAFMPGNLFLGVAFGAATYLAASVEQDGVRDTLFQGTVWAVIPVIVAALAVVALSAVDILGAVWHVPGDKHTFHWRQLLGPTKIHHNVVVYGLYTWLMVALGVPGLLLAPPGVAGILGRITLLCSLGAWVRMLVLDARNPRHQTAHIRLYGLMWVTSWACWALITVLTGIAVYVVLF